MTKTSPELRLVPDQPCAPAEMPTGLLVWTMMSEPQRVYLIRDWMTHEWPCFKDFCAAHGMDYSSMWRVFNDKGISNPDRSVNHEPLEQLNTALCETVLNAVRLTDTVISNIIQKLAQKSLTLPELQSLLNRLTTDGTKLGYLVTAVNSSIAVRSGFSADAAPSGLGKVPIPPEVQRALQGRLSGIGEHMVKVGG